MLINNVSDQIHARAVEASTRYKRAEAELVEILQQAEEHQVFVHRGHSSLFNYVIAELGLSESVAYSLIAVARKAREVPELKTQMQAGAITLSNARRVAVVLTPQNQNEWIAKASTLSSRALEKEIVRVMPQEAVRERASYVTPERMKLEVGLSEHEMARLRRVQDLLSQSEGRPMSLEETITALTSEFLRRHDPIEKAKRNQAKKEQTKKETSNNQAGPHDKSATKQDELSKTILLGKPAARKPAKERGNISAATLHQVSRRDQGRCAYILKDGSRCNRTRWIEIHHKKPVSEGGTDDLNNLITLCSTHHRFWHLQNGPPGRQLL